MTSRLKRRLGDLGVDPSSARANESFCLIGTPLPPLEKSRDTGEFVPLWKQDVRDEQGRRRLHGAFTGGFSAGYFNSVGSKEGWTPQTFVSSRNDRAKQKAARPEDFMDDEDLQEIRDSQKIVDTADEMDLTGGTQAGLANKMTGDEPDSIASALESAMLPAANDSAGARILKKMGWRLGQGIGPRVTLRQRRIQDLRASGKPFTEADLQLEDEDEEAKKHMYAPRDFPVLLVNRKDNFHGIGYHPGTGLNESLGMKGDGSISGPTISAGFGLGALNDADEDDIDIYDSSTSRGRERMAYDLESGPDDDTITIGRSSNKRKVPPQSIPGATFMDGTPILAGFVALQNAVTEDRWFPLPDVPPDWTPDPKRVWNKNTISGKENIHKSQAPTNHERWRTGITADERGSMLGETPLPSAPRSVFDFMSQKDRERLKNVTASRFETPADISTSSTPYSSASTSITFPFLDPQIASAALRGFQPFTSDPQKQVRYTAYLDLQANPGSAPSSFLKPLPGQRVSEFNRELSDFAKSAQIFKPVSGAMAGRFTSAAIVENGPKVHAGLHTPTTQELEEKERKEKAEEEKKKETEEELSPKAHAAKMGMYGVMTRETTSWQPARLLCKRFGVKDPDPIPDAEQDAAGRKPDTAAEYAAKHAESLGIAPEDLPAASGPRDLKNIGLGEDDSQGKDTLTYERPAMDVFKAIFASDDEDSDDEKPADEPPPLPSNEAETVVEEVKVPEPTAPSSEPFDINTFKPTFISRKPKIDDKDKKKKKKKDKKAALVSFGDDEGESLSIKPQEKNRPKKKRRKEKKQAEEDDGMWVEKPTADAVKNLEGTSSLVDIAIASPEDQQSPTISGSHKGRKRAIDFL